MSSLLEELVLLVPDVGTGESANGPADQGLFQDIRALVPLDDAPDRSRQLPLSEPLPRRSSWNALLCCAHAPLCGCQTASCAVSDEVPPEPPLTQEETPATVSPTWPHGVTQPPVSTPTTKTPSAAHGATLAVASDPGTRWNIVNSGPTMCGRRDLNLRLSGGAALHSHTLRLRRQMLTKQI